MNKLFITYYGNKTKMRWSGTIDVLLDKFSSLLNTDVPCWVIEPNYPIFYKKLLVLYSRCFFMGLGVARDRNIMPFVKRKTLKQICKFSHENDWIMMPGEHCLDERFPNRHYCCYIDTDFPMTAIYDTNRNKWGYKRYIKQYDKYTVQSYAKMDVIFTQNEWTRKSIIERFNIPSDKVYNVGFGVNIVPYDGPKDYSKKLLLIVLRQFNAKMKGLDILIEALPIIRKQYPDCKLAVVGNDQYEDVDGVDCYVDFPREKTMELFQQSSLYVMPSRCEPNGITYLEALINKTPFVALNRFAAPEFSGHGEWSFLCDNESAFCVADVVCKALSNEARLVKMGLKGQVFVKERYNWDIVIGEMFNVMDKRR